MEITLERSRILDSLSHACRIIERRNVSPISCHILLQTVDGSLKMQASGPEIEITEIIPANVKIEGSATIPAQLLHDIVRKLPDGSELRLSRDSSRGDGIAVASGCSNFFLQSFSEKGFPSLEKEDCKHSFKLKSSVLRRLIERTHFAMATEETRYYLNGIFFHLQEEKGRSQLCAAATDGHRLAVAHTDISEEIKGMPSIIVPRKAVHEIRRLLSMEDSDIKINISEARIYLEISSSLFMSARLIDGIFPRYQDFIPDTNDKELRVRCDNLRRAVDRVSTVSSERSRAVKFSLSPGQLSMTVDNPDIGKAIEELSVSYSSDSMDIGFNSKYILEIAENISGDGMVFLLKDSNSSALIRGEKDEDAFCILMPIRI
ncbi:DNA polymerase III subunit beta [Candidatus Liberibacter sp.]|uniref:DNA polymerase III subunit beta n=1 Tax=Candidatus Liberibacter sp. TaxID=34022 RepID=UPI0015F5C107|nr:DNA polymerase III subunit beta [Candidatus Liberibacter sp.]MBA5723772.1 DNA polymerase III subunit beta [Candidatus Liberibacter sp.]